MITNDMPSKKVASMIWSQMICYPKRLPVWYDHKWHAIQKGCQYDMITNDMPSKKIASMIWSQMTCIKKRLPVWYDHKWHAFNKGCQYDMVTNDMSSKKIASMIWSQMTSKKVASMIWWQMTCLPKRLPVWYDHKWHAIQKDMQQCAAGWASLLWLYGQVSMHDTWNMLRLVGRWSIKA